jgi:hypothetical protein
VESRRRTCAEVRAQVELPFSAMVALMAGLVRGFTSVYHSGDGIAGSDRGDFQRMHTRSYLWIVSGSH